MRVAGLEQMGWIADALAAADADRPLPPSFSEQSGTAAFNRLLSDPQVPHTAVPLRHDPTTFGPSGVTKMLQQAAAFPAAVLALANDDPLVGAIDTVYHVAIAHGNDRDHFLTEVHTALN
jgi:hypothetical protein